MSYQQGAIQKSADAILANFYPLPPSADTLMTFFIHPSLPLLSSSRG